MDITIRSIRPDDAAPWRDLWTAYLDFYETSVPDNVYQITLGRLCSTDHPDQNGLMALRGDAPVGLVHYIYHPHNWRPEKVCYLQDLYIAPSERGRGLGRHLIEAVYDRADADGCPSVYWLTQDFNTPARRLYDRVGKLTPFIKYTRP